MKKILKSAALIIAFSFCSTISNAQEVAHVNLDSLISLMPEYKEAEKAVQEYALQLQSQIGDMNKELEAKYTEYQTKGPDMAQIVRADKEKEIKALSQRIQEFQQQAELDYQQKSASLISDVQKKAKLAINQVAKEKAYKYVLDTSTGVVLYFEPTQDIFAQVAAKLGLTIK